MPTEKGLHLGTIRGIPIRAGWSLLIIIWLLTWSLAASGLPSLAKGYSGAEYWLAAALTAVAFFASLLAHELSHALVAQRRGAHVHDITLWLLGGVSRIEEEPATPGDDLRIALAGPATSVAISVAAGVVAILVGAFGVPALFVACLVWLASINLLLAIFNLVPAAPLDGGRVLRALLWRRGGDRTRAALAATRAGRVFAYVLIATGFALFLSAADVSGIWFVLLGAFLLMMSHAEEMQVKMARDLQDVRVREVMTSDPITVPGDLSVEDVLHEFMLRYHCSSFPVVDAAGHVTGLVTLRRLRALPAHRRSTTRVADIAQPMSEVAQAAPDELLLDVLPRTARSQDGRLLVFDADTRLVGIVSSSDIARVVQIAEVEHAR